MALYKATKSLPEAGQQQITAFYETASVYVATNSQYPHPQDINLFRVREQLNEWIDETFLTNTLSSETSEYELQVREWHLDFVRRLELLPAGPCSPHSSSTSQGLQFQVLHPGFLYEQIKSCLAFEMKLLANDAETSMSNISGKLLQCAMVQEAIDAELKVLQRFAANEQATSSQSGHVENPWPIDTMLHDIRAKKIKASDLNTELASLVYGAISAVQQLVDRHFDVEAKFLQILQERIRRNEPVAGQTYYNTSLKKIAAFHTVVHQLKQHLERFTNSLTLSAQQQPSDLLLPFQNYNYGPHYFNIITQLMNKTTALLQSLIRHSIAVVKQPSTSQIIKKAHKFEVSVKCFGGETLELARRHPQIKMVLLNDKQAVQLANSHALTDDIKQGCGVELQQPENEEDKVQVVHDPGSSTCNILFKDVAVPDRPPHQSKLHSVLSSKFYILFYSTVHLNGIPYETWAYTAPFVITTNVSQDVKATATIFWDTYLVGSDPFQVPEQVTIQRLAQGLSRYVLKETSTKWRLTDTNLDYLVYKIFPNQELSAGTVLKRVDFYKLIQERDRSPSKEPLFWNWFLACVKLIKDHLSSYWEQGYIVGFIDRNKAEEMLPLDVGSFILRFPDSILGGLSASWRHPDGRVLSGVFPIQDKFLPWKNLGTMILGEATLLQLYHYNPHTKQMGLKPKMEVFSLLPQPQSPVSGEAAVGTGLTPRKPYVSSTFTWSLPFPVPQVVPSRTDTN